MAKLQALVCTECGGHIDRDTMTCRYCGVQYKLDSYDNPIIIRRLDPKVTTLNHCFEVTDEVTRYMGAEQMSEYLLKEMKRRLAEQLMPYMECEVVDEPRTCSKRVYGRIRVVSPDYRFGE